MGLLVDMGVGVWLGNEADCVCDDDGRPRTERGRLPRSGMPMDPPMMDWNRESSPTSSGGAVLSTCKHQQI